MKRIILVPRPIKNLNAIEFIPSRHHHNPVLMYWPSEYLLDPEPQTKHIVAVGELAYTPCYSYLFIIEVVKLVSGKF